MFHSKIPERATEVRFCSRSLLTEPIKVHVARSLFQVLELTDFNKRHKSSSFKPFNFACILKFSKAQLEEKAFKDGLVEQLYDLLMEHFHIHSHTVGFPELVLPAVIQVRSWVIMILQESIHGLPDHFFATRIVFLSHLLMPITYPVGNGHNLPGPC